MITKQLAKYGAVGIVSTSIHFIVASLFAFIVGHSLVFANLTGYFVDDYDNAD